MTQTYLGVKNGQLSECPSSPNCVSTQTDDIKKRMPALSYDGGKTNTKNLVKTILSQHPRSSIDTESENYIHAVFTSKFMRFKDDVEFYFDDVNKLVHFRSASRVGYSDFGVNRKRMETITQTYKEEASREF